jgi:tetratricopeptide (TPR) repeat protein
MHGIPDLEARDAQNLGISGMPPGRKRRHSGPGRVACPLPHGYPTMNASRRPADRLRVDRFLGFLPDLPALRSIRENLLAASRPDHGRRWTGSGELGTVGGRVIDADRLAESIPAMLSAEAERAASRAERVLGLARAMEANDWEGAMEVLMEAGERSEADGLADEAEAWFLAARDLGVEAGSPRRTEALRKAARAARNAARLGDAARRYEEAWREASDSGLVPDAVVAATGRGNVAVDRGAWAEAERWYLEGLQLAEPAALPDDEGAALRWPLAQNLSITAREMGRLDASATWLERAAAWARDAHGEGSDGAHQLDIENGLGQLALARGNPALAEAHFRAALEGPGAPLSRIGVLVNLGEALLASGRALEAGQVARQAELDALRNRVAGRLPQVYRLLAEVARFRGEPEAFVFLDRALELCRTHALPPWEEARTLRLYAAFRRAEGEEEAASAAEQRAAELEGEVQ